MDLKIAIRARPKFVDKKLQQTLQKGMMRPQRSMGLGKTRPQAQTHRTRPCSLPLPAAWVIPAPSSKKPEEREFVVDSGASMHTAE